LSFFYLKVNALIVQSIAGSDFILSSFASFFVVHKGDADFLGRMFFDLSFFVIVGVLLFNVITGLMVDGFGALRDEANERADVRAKKKKQTNKLIYIYLVQNLTCSNGQMWCCRHHLFADQHILDLTLSLNEKAKPSFLVCFVDRTGRPTLLCCHCVSRLTLGTHTRRASCVAICPSYLINHPPPNQLLETLSLSSNTAKGA